MICVCPEQVACPLLPTPAMPMLACNGVPMNAITPERCCTVHGSGQQLELLFYCMIRTPRYLSTVAPGSRVMLHCVDTILDALPTCYAWYTVLKATRAYLSSILRFCQVILPNSCVDHCLTWGMGRTRSTYSTLETSVCRAT